LKMTIEIGDFPINSMMIFHSYVSLPDGTPSFQRELRDCLQC